jgi:hypothetical protein
MHLETYGYPVIDRFVFSENYIPKELQVKLDESNTKSVQGTRNFRKRIENSETELD